MESGLDARQVQHFRDEGYLIVRDLLPPEALQEFITELEVKVEEAVREAVDTGCLAASDTFPDAPFDQRLALAARACSDHLFFWDRLQGKQHKTAGMFRLRTWPSLLDATESLIGPEIFAHPQTVLRPKLPDLEDGIVPWHQDLAYLKPEEAGETLVVNFWIPLVDATAENGCLQVLAGSHRAGLLPHDHRVPRYHGVAEEDLPAGEVVTCEVAVGDALMTMERLLHRSLPHTTDSVRWSLDTRYSRTGLPTGRANKPGFIARSRKNPASVARSHLDWIRAFEEMGLDWTEKVMPAGKG